MWPYPWTHVGTPSHLKHMDRVAATMPFQAHAGAAQEAPDIGQLEGQDVPLVRPSFCNVKAGIPSSRRYLPTYLPIVAKNILPCGSLKNTMTTAAIRMGEGHVVHSCRDCEVEVPMGSQTIAHWFYVMDTEAFDFVLGTDFFVQHCQIHSLTLQAPYLLYVDHSHGRESVPLEQWEHTSSYLRVSKEEPSNMMAASNTEDYQLLGEVIDQGLKELGYSREDPSVELLASDEQHVLDLYCSKGKNCSYKFTGPPSGWLTGTPGSVNLGRS